MQNLLTKDRRLSGGLAIAELLLLLAGCYFAGTALLRIARYTAFQSGLVWLFGRDENEKGAPVLLTVPRLGMSVLVVNGADEKNLALGAGHINGTSQPGELGNSVIAGHRDLAFRKLCGIKIGDEVHVQSDRTYKYIVDKISIVDPSDVSVLANDGQAKLTLITCYPFNYMGTAPKRYVVQAGIYR